MNYEDELYSEFGTLAMLGAFTQTDEGNPALVPYWHDDYDELGAEGYHPDFGEWEEYANEQWWDDEDEGGG